MILGKLSIGGETLGKPRGEGDAKPEEKGRRVLLFCMKKWMYLKQQKIIKLTPPCNVLDDPEILKRR